MPLNSPWKLSLTLPMYERQLCCCSRLYACSSLTHPRRRIPASLPMVSGSVCNRRRIRPRRHGAFLFTRTVVVIGPGCGCRGVCARCEVSPPIRDLGRAHRVLVRPAAAPATDGPSEPDPIAAQIRPCQPARRPRPKPEKVSRAGARPGFTVSADGPGFQYRGAGKGRMAKRTPGSCQTRRTYSG